MRLLWFNLATDADDPILGFAAGWIGAIAKRVEFVNVISMSVGRYDLPGNVRVHSVGKEKGYSEPRRAIEFYRHLFRILHSERIDGCFSHMIPIFTVLAAPFLRRREVPLVTWYAHRQVTRLLKWAHHLSTRMASVNEASYPYRNDKLSTLGHGIDTDLFSPRDTCLENPPLLLSVGRLSPIKDPLTLIAAVALLRERGHELRCALVGPVPNRDRSYAERIRHQISAYRLGDVVELVGPVHRPELVPWYRRCLAHVNCSPPDHALDKAALEAMACAKPSFSSVEGFGETVGRWARHLLFRHGDARDLAEKLGWLLQLDQARRECVGRELRENVVKMHSLFGLVDRLHNIFRTITA